MKIGIVVAADLNNGIGKQGKIPWRLSEDLKHFKYITTQTQFKDRQNAVIMGRLTWDSLPKSFRPLPDRLNIILTRNEALHLPEGVLKASSLETALEGLQTASLATKIDQVFIIGGGEIYKEAL
ncbi:MAG: dihydrofolate reductase/thymidylate synthase, partial [Candidatus Marinamargulisbacteria bacterium]